MTQSSAIRSGDASPFGQSASRGEKVGYIRQVASEHFNKQGFDATSLDKVAEQIGISKPSIYYYYKNKSQLLLDCYTRTLDICDRLIEEAEALDGTALEKLCHFTRQLILLHCANGAIAIVSEIGSVPPEAVPEMRARNARLTERLLNLTKAGVADGSMRADIGKPTIFFIMGGLNWIPRWHNDEGQMQAEEIADSYIRFLLNGVSDMHGKRDR